MNRVKVGFFSLSGPGGSDDDAGDHAYLAWHQLDHMPEQYQLPGIVHGQRWMSDDACRAARSVASGAFEDVHHVVLYLMGEPVEQTLDDFFDLGSRLAHLGRFPRDLPRRFLGALRLLDARAAPRVLVSAEVVPFRPNRGVYLIVEQPGDGDRIDPYLRWRQDEHLERLVAAPGVAGAWVFATAAALPAGPVHRGRLPDHRLLPRRRPGRDCRRPRAAHGRGVARRTGHAVAGGPARLSGSMGLAGWRLSVI